MAFALLWDSSRDPYLGFDYTVYGGTDRPAALLGQTWSAEAMNSWAREYNVDVVVSGSTKEPGLIAGYPSENHSTLEEWITSGYPCVRQPCMTKASSLITDPSLIKLFDSGATDLSFIGARAEQAAGAAQSYYRKLGWNLNVEERDSLSQWTRHFRLLFPRLALVAPALVLLLAGGHTLSRSKVVGVQMLNGSARWQIALADVLESSVRLWLLAITTLAIAYTAAALLIQAHFFHRFAVSYLVIVTLLWLVCLGGQLFGHQTLRLTRILDAIKGRVRYGLTFPAVYALRYCVLVMVGGLSLSFMNNLGELRDQEKTQEEMQSLSVLSSLGVSPVVADDRVLQDLTAQQMTPLYHAGKIFFSRAQPQFFYLPTAGNDPYALTDDIEHTVIEANAEYLRFHVPLLADGRQLDLNKDVPSSRVTLLFPEGTPEKTRQAMRERVAHSRLVRGTFVTAAAWDLQNVPLAEVTLARGNVQYAMGGRLRRVSDPLMVVYPQALNLGRDFVYSGGGAVLLRTEDAASVLAVAPALSKGAAQLQPLSSIVQDSIESTRDTLSRQVLELIGILIVLLFCTVGVVALYARQHARRVFAQTLFGRPWIEVTPMLFALGGVTIAAISWVAWPRPANLTDFHAYGQDALLAPQRNFLIVGSVLVALIILEVIIMRKLQERIVTERGTLADD